MVYGVTDGYPVRMVDCLDAALCDHIIDTTRDYEAATVVASKNPVLSKDRNNSIARLTEDLKTIASDQINQALLNWSEQIKSEYPSEIMECLYLPGAQTVLRETISVLKYEQGQEYKWHVDRALEPDCFASSRRVSVVVYLNDDFKGGETEVIDRKYKPQKGKALIFPSDCNYPHRACPVEEGTKYALVTWFHEKSK